MPKSKHRKKHKQKVKNRKNRSRNSNRYSKNDLQAGMLGLLGSSILNAL